jgi:hypothetical protein
MYRFSRSIYRELAPRVVEDEWDPTGCANKQKVLDACEGAICRLTYDRRYFARPARTLFGALVFAFSLTAFVAPPFSGLDTLPALGVVIMSLGLLLADFVLVAAGTLIGCLGVAAVIGLGGLVVQVVRDVL